MIKIDSVSKTIKGQEILCSINAEMDYGKVYGFVGRNGSGKTMLLKAICGFITPDMGYVTIDGKQVGKEIDFPEDIGVIIEKPAFIPYISGYDNLCLLADIRKKIDREKIKEEMELFGLDWNNRKKVKNYSVGMKQRLALVQAFMEEPKILILDEAMNGLDKEGVVITKERIRKAKEEGKMILICSHIVGDLEELCDCIFEIDSGHLSLYKEVNM